MTISLDAIYQPLNKFFLQKFGQGDSASIFFRFAQQPVGFYDSDFLVPQNPEWGPSPALAKEQFSILVDRITRLEVDGQGVWLDPSRISDLYHDEIMGPSIPYVPTDAVDSDKQALVDSFNQIKSDAISKWESCKAASLINNGTEFRPCSAAPDGWWNTSDTGVWTSQEFQIQGAATTTTAPQPPVLLRMKICDSALKPILMTHLKLAESPAAPRVVRTGDLKALKRPATLSRSTLLAAKPMLSATIADAVAAPRTRALSPARSVALHSDLVTRSAAMPLRNRLELQTLLGQSAPTQSVAVTDVTISFDYCLVTVSRPWMHAAFLNCKSWYIPQQSKGSLSANDGHGVPALPVAFIALKNLMIKGPWTPADVTNLELSDQFGPFLIDSTVVNGAIGHEGIQVVGWILQDVPELPPLDGFIA